MANKKQNKKPAKAKKVSAISPTKATKQEKQLPKPIKKTNNKKVAVGIAVLVVVVGLGFLIGEYIQTRDELNKARDPQSAAQTNAENILKDVGKYLELPKDEKPTTATITDKEKLQDQPFFKKAENGDKVLIYAKSQRAILYRPSTKKVVEFAPVNLGTGDQKDGTNPKR